MSVTTTTTNKFDFLSKGALVGALSFVGFMSTLFKQPALGAFMSDPHTAELATGIVSGIGAIVAGAWQSWRSNSIKVSS